MSGAWRWRLLAGTWTIYFCFGLTTASLAPLVPLIRAEFGIGNAMMGAILGAWPLAYILAAIPCGMLLDRIGPRAGLFLAALIMAASGVMRAWAEGPVGLMLAVAVFGLGGPLISIGAPKLMAALFEGKARGTAMGIYMTGPYLGGIAALALTPSVFLPLAGGDWRLVVLALAGLVLLAGLVWLAVLGRVPATARVALGEGKRFELDAFRALLGLAEVRLILLMSVGIFMINHTLNNWLPTLLISKGLSAEAAGFWSAVPAAVGVLGVLVIPRLATPNRRYRVMAALFIASLAASLLLQAAPGLGVATGLVLQGLARSSMMTVAILLLMETPGVPKERLGLAGGLFFTAAEVGGVLGPILFGALSEASGGFAVPLAGLSLVCLSLLGLLAVLARSRHG